MVLGMAAEPYRQTKPKQTVVRMYLPGKGDHIFLSLPPPHNYPS